MFRFQEYISPHLANMPKPASTTTIITIITTLPPPPLQPPATGKIYPTTIRQTCKGPGTLASISPVSDYWTNWPSVEDLAFVKAVRNVEILNLEPKKDWCFFC